MAPSPKIIVLDDDPTGSQTVHSCLLLLRWDVETLVAGLRDDSPILFILTNTRALTPTAAAAVTQTVCQNLKQAVATCGLTEFLVVSRSDSTLRGHYPIETDVIAQEMGPFDAHFLIPAFFEGGRVTLESTHYIRTAEGDIPVHETEFARDSVFGYSTAYLPDYAAEKTGGRVAADGVVRFTLETVRQGCREQLLALENNVCCVVDGEVQADLNRFAADALAATAQGKRFLFRSAASILTALAALPPQPVDADHMGTYVRDGQPGAVVVGSHVQKTTDQLGVLLQAPGVSPVNVEVARLLDPSDAAYDTLLAEVLQQVHHHHGQGKTPVIYTSREELTFDDIQTRLDFGVRVSALLMDVVRGLPDRIGFLISKGGITSNDTLSQGLALTQARLLGQILPGVSLVRTPADHPQFADLPVVLFPGNVGDQEALAVAYRRLSQA